MKRILVIGNGFLGSTVLSVARRRGMKVQMGSLNSRLVIDVRKIETIRDAVCRTDPDAIINCAALTEVDRIEKEPGSAHQVNARGAENVAKVAAEYSKRLVHISTDSVFGGKRGDYLETDMPDPINEYGRSKKNGEDGVMKNTEDCVVVRTNFYGNDSDGRFLYCWMLDNFKHGRKFHGFTNIIFNPLEIGNLSSVLLELSELRHTGILHVATDVKYSKYEFAIAIARKLGYDESLVVPKELKNDELAALRPHNTTLNNELAKRVLKTKLLALETWLEGQSR